jgi:hypothetical protein
MKTVIVSLFALTLLGATAAEAQINIHVGPTHHRHRVCFIRHHHRVCSWR